MLAQGHSRRAIARHLGRGLNTVLRYANATRWQDTIRDNRPRPNRLNPYKPYLERRSAERCTGVIHLHNELVAKDAPRRLPDGPRTRRYPPQGFNRRAAPATESAAGDRLDPRHPKTLTEEVRAGLREVLARCPELDKAAGRVRDFGETLIDRLGARLPAWIDAVDASRLPGLTGFALPLLRDLDAVTAGLTLDWSSGSLEGAVNRIKKTKRQLYGRAGFEPLPKMFLLQ
ncbi:hypothetical protein [Streptomyces sp. enrichment culture]|uniref:hypothetical protein n=1 Tax=Streptomyces sp. enrichment culture TaxID=1795815 RepID=UPI003F56D2AB